MIGLIAAMNSEINAVTAKMNEVKITKVGNVEFREGQLQDEQIVIALSGVGKVNAAIASTLMCHLYPIDALLSIGVAGGLQDEQEVGDLVISDAAIQVDFDTSALDGPSGIGMKFDADLNLVNRAKQVAQKTNLKWRVETVATQDLFLASKEDYEYLMSRFSQAACNEMEGASVAQVATSFHVPFLILRTLSDVVTHEGNPVEFETFEKQAALQVADFFEEFCKKGE